MLLGVSPLRFSEDWYRFVAVNRYIRQSKLMISFDIVLNGSLIK